MACSSGCEFAAKVPYQGVTLDSGSFGAGSASDGVFSLNRTKTPSLTLPAPKEAVATHKSYTLPLQVLFNY